MKQDYQERLKDLIGGILKPFSRQGALQKQFTEQFFGKLPLPDLERLDAAHAASIADSAFAFMRERQRGVPKIRLQALSNRRLALELINDDMPFLVDSLSAELLRLGCILHETIHPIFHVVRDKAGVLQELVQKGAGAPESFIHFELSPLPADLTPEQLEAQLNVVLSHVKVAVRDWQTIAERTQQTEAEAENDETRAFLSWLRERNFVFLGYRDAKETLGICTLGVIPHAQHNTGRALEITKSNDKALVHRPVLMDVITIGTRQFVGLFTSSVYYQSADAIPILRRKIASVLTRSGYDPASHDGKALKAILEFMPRDELFQYGEDELFAACIGILSLENKPGVRLFVRRDPFERFISAMVFVPREHFSTDLRKTIQQMLAISFQATPENFQTQISDAPLARLHLILRTTPGAVPEVDVAAIESDIARHTHLWGDALMAALVARFGEHKAEEYMRLAGNAFPQAYTSRYSIHATVYDITKIADCLQTGNMVLDVFRVRSEPEYLHLKIYSPTEEIALSDILPMLENFGLRAIEEHPYLVTPQNAPPVWIRDFKLTYAELASLSLEQVKPLLEEAMGKVWRGEMENDRFNTLVLKANLHWRQVTCLRAYAKYLRQIGFASGGMAIAQALAGHAALTKLLVALFAARFDPDAGDHDSKQQYIISQIDVQLAQVTSLAEDRILRRYLELIQATLRTNYFQDNKPVLSFKLNSKAVPELPLPLPHAEIFVYSPRVEGIHLRGGKVARGGLRWSDRHEDFRTEVLGLMKAQMVKNAVIVPVGSKGGFVVKKPPAARDAYQQEGIACYQMYLRGMLDITDNISGGNVVPPARTVRHDGDDPYLVVAADKGTATFSDIANGISREYGFWLDDAFASGGSAGYDHKEMGITARGGWISVLRHFREAGVDIAKEQFTATGIGDMAGDVFGNGMLLSDTMKLVAAFNHMHIFIDPNPDAKASFAERQRLFHLPRSTWKDYNASLISTGGGVFERSAKTISLSAEARAVLGTTREQFTPDELIRVILTAPVDLLWNGGIGTYVKAESETHDQVGDRANNTVRVNGKELRCKVVGEGGNLGFTQKGRIEYARSGGRINTDAIDNSGGVDCSDHEVNIKIAFSAAVSSGKLTREKRDDILRSMTDEVAGLVLRDNRLQTQAITLAQLQGAQALESQGRLMQRLEREGLLNRAIEFLPEDRQLTELHAAGQGLTRPELAVLLAYSKIALYNELIASSLPDEAYFAADLAKYFPKVMQQDFLSEIAQHPLKREIICTMVTNSLVNRAGITFFWDIAEDTGLPPREIAAAYTLARDLFSLRALWVKIEALDVASTVQAEMLLAVNTMIARLTLWLLRRCPHPLSLETVQAEFAPGIAEFRSGMEAMHSAATRKAYDKFYAHLAESGVDEVLAAEVSNLEMLGSALDVITVAKDSGRSIADAGTAYFALGAELQLGWLRHHALRLKAGSHWDRLAIAALVQDLYDEQRRLATATSVDEEAKARYMRFFEDIHTRESQELSTLLVALRHIKTL